MSDVDPHAAKFATLRRRTRAYFFGQWLVGVLFLCAGLTSISLWRAGLMLLVSFTMFVTTYQMRRLGQLQPRSSPVAQSIRERWRNQAAQAGWPPMLVQVMTIVTLAMLLIGTALFAASSVSAYLSS